MSRPWSGSAIALLRALANQGVTDALTDAVKKRIRMTNVLSVFGAVLMAASVPFDALEAPRWMVIEDIVGAFAYLAFPLLNRAGYLRLSRLLCLVVSDLIVLGNVAMLGPSSGTQMVFFALAVAPFALYELRDRLAIALGVVAPVACFVAGSAGWLTRFQHTPGGFHAGTYYAYSAAVTLAILIFCVYLFLLARELSDSEEVALLTVAMTTAIPSPPACIASWSKPAANMAATSSRASP